MPIDVASYLKFTPTDDTGSFAADTEGHVYYDDSEAQLKHYDGSNWGRVSNVPAFMVQISASQTDIEYATYTKILFDEEIWDTNSDFASYKFTPTVAGNYFIGVNVYLSDIPDARYLATVIYKNGSSAFLNRAHSSQNQEIACYTSAIIAMNGSSDYIEGYGVHTDSVAKSFIGGRSYASTYMFGFLIA